MIEAETNDLNLRQRVGGHLRTITEHKMMVMDLCFKAGLYRQGLLHDLSKYSPIELKTGFRYYCGHRSPNALEREAAGYSGAWLHHKGRNKHHFEYWTDIIPSRMNASAQTDKSAPNAASPQTDSAPTAAQTDSAPTAAQTDSAASASTSQGQTTGGHAFLEALPAPASFGIVMPTRYVVEMFCDRVAACKVYQKEKYTDSSALAYFRRESSKGKLMHPETHEFIESLLVRLSQEGEEQTLRYIRENIVKPRAGYGIHGRF